MSLEGLCQHGEILNFHMDQFSKTCNRKRSTGSHKMGKILCCNNSPELQVFTQLTVPSGILSDMLCSLHADLLFSISPLLYPSQSCV